VITEVKAQYGIEHDAHHGLRRSRNPRVCSLSRSELQASA
jgi:hypothetical protein